MTRTARRSDAFPTDNSNSYHLRNLVNSNDLRRPGLATVVAIHYISTTYTVDNKNHHNSFTSNDLRHNKPPQVSVLGGPPCGDCPSVSSFPLPPAVRRTKYRGARTNPWDPKGSLACARVIVPPPGHEVKRLTAHVPVLRTPTTASCPIFARGSAGSPG